MVRLKTKAQKKKGPSQEETVSLVSGAAAAASSSSGGGIFGRLKHLMVIVLIACLVFFIWESIEWDNETGDVQLTIHKGSNTGSGTGGSNSTAAQKSAATASGSDEEKQRLDDNGEPIDDDLPDIMIHPPQDTETATTETEAPVTQTTPPVAETAAPVTETAAPVTETTPPVIETTPPVTETTPPITETTPPVTGATPPPQACTQQCAAIPVGGETQTPPKDKFFEGRDLTQSAVMLERVQTVWQEWIDNRLLKDYGEEYYHAIFERTDPATGQKFHVGNQQAFKDPQQIPFHGEVGPASTVAWDRMIRKYQIKLLQVQLGMVQQQLHPQQYCLDQCAIGEKGNMEDQPLEDGLYSRFLWVCGGHSASAGHGNFYRESYTANLGRDLGPLLKQIGLDWQVKNYAMGGTESGEEVALCFNSIFGRNVDTITWDYGMVDGNEVYKMAIYAYRASRLALLPDSVSQPGNIRHRPNLFGLHMNDGNIKVQRALQDLGMTVMGMDLPYMQTTVQGGFPDTFGLNDAQISALPPYVQYFKCEGKIEAGDPGCQENKFNNTLCEKRAAKTSWHPGWKYHALVGHILAFTILQVITESLQGLVTLEPAATESLEAKETRLQAQLQQLDAAEQADYENMFNTPIPPILLELFHALWTHEHKEENKKAMEHMSIEMLVKEPSFCHTAMLPAEIRFQGLLTENPDLVGDVLDQHYEFGVSQAQIRFTEAPGPQWEGKVPAVYNNPRAGLEWQMIIGMKDDEHQVCEEQLNADYKDYFVVTSLQDWRAVPFPNAMEKTHYTEFDTTKTHGWIFFCMAKCDWGKCPEGDIRQNVMEFTTDPNYGQIQMEINLVAVTGINCMNDCCALKHALTTEDPNDPMQPFYWPPGPDGSYTFRARIIGGQKWGYARFSSFILV